MRGTIHEKETRKLSPTWGRKHKKCVDKDSNSGLVLQFVSRRHVGTHWKRWIAMFGLGATWSGFS